MSKTKKEIAVITPAQAKEVASVEGFIGQAIEKGVSVETMERLFSLREKVKAEQAKEAFVQALAYFQADCPIIKKTKKVLNKDGRSVRYQYAPIDSIVEQIKKPLSSNSLSYTWTVKNEEGFITAIATLTHVLGHSVSSDFKVPIDKEGFMSAPQKYASALTFAKRYSLCNVLGISTGDEDTDAVDVNKEKEPKSDKSKIVFLLRKIGYETSVMTKEEITEAIKKAVGLTLEEKNYGEIVGRLEVLVTENQDNDNSKVR